MTVLGIKEKKKKETRKKEKEKKNRICFIKKKIPFLPVQNSDLISEAHNFSHASEENVNITSRPRILRQHSFGRNRTAGEIPRHLQ